MTVFVGGNRYPRGIITFDWNTLTYTKHETELIRDRRWTSCALLRGSKGEPLVVIAGGISEGTEVWNPQDGTIELIVDDFPHITSIPNGHARMVSINEESDLLLYGGHYVKTPGFSVSTIWKFSGLNNTWSEYGNMLGPRNDHVILAVNDISCPV